MRLSHARRAIDARFDDPNLVSCAGLVPVMALADRCGLASAARRAAEDRGEGRGERRGEDPRAGRRDGLRRGLDHDMDLLRHGGMGRLFTGVRAPSTLGTFLRLFTFGHVRQLDAVAAGLLARLAAATPVLPDADQLVFVDIDDTVRQTYGYAKQGAGRGYTGIKGLNALLAVVSTPTSAPLIAATRLRQGVDELRPRRGQAAGRRAGHRPPRRGAAGLVLVRADSAYYGYDIVAACRRAGARFSVTARLTPTVVKAITSIDEQAWTPIRYPNAIYDEDEQRWISDAEVAEVGFTAFTGRRKRRARHRPADRAPGPPPQPDTRCPAGQAGKQGELFAVYRYHAVFTDSPEPMLAAEATHRDHAIVEQVIAELKNGPLAHLPSGGFTANAAWLVCAAIAHNLTRAAGALAGGRHRRARTATIRAQLIHTPARIAHSAHRQVLHLPRDWPWEPGLDELFRRALHDPLPAAA